MLCAIAFQCRGVSREQDAVIFPERNAGDQRQTDECHGGDDRGEQIPA